MSHAHFGMRSQRGGHARAFVYDMFPLSDVPTGSSLVENHMTCVELLMLGRQRRTERIPRRPWVRGCATPYTLRLGFRGALKFGAPCTVSPRSSARPAIEVR